MEIYIIFSITIQYIIHPPLGRPMEKVAMLRYVVSCDEHSAFQCKELHSGREGIEI